MFLLGKASKKQREIVWFFTKGGVPPPPLKFGPISSFFLGKNGKSFRGLVFYGVFFLRLPLELQQLLKLSTSMVDYPKSWKSAKYICA
jgi:hypothetical protein